MLVTCLVVFLFYVFGQCFVLNQFDQNYDQKLIECILGVLNKYFFEISKITYASANSDGDEVLKAIHSSMNFSVISRLATEQMFVTNTGYLVHVADAPDFIQYFEFLIREPAWNPYAKFLIIVKTLQEAELNLIFDELLRLHVNNVLVVNGTAEAKLYTYNPFDNYACGKYYDKVISYGICSQTTSNLYPNKLVTGLRNCNFRASVTHRPPFTVDPSKADDKNTLLGTEQFIITLLGKIEQFTVNFSYNYDGNLFSTVEPNMTAIGPMQMLQKNECDIIFGAFMLVTSRAEAFTYLSGYHDYTDELRFAVKSASLVPTWKYIYLEFNFEVWILLIVTFVIFSVIVLILLRSEDKGEVVLRLLDNLLLHGRDVRTRFTVKCILMTWVWFTYLINTFYQSTLFSFTTHPSFEYQVSDENDIYKYNFKPCFSEALQNYLSSETDKQKKLELDREGCHTTVEAMTTVSTTKNMFTLLPNYVYLYDEGEYTDKWGKHLIYYFDKPFTKFLFGFYFYKGFPITKSLQLNALRMRESGLAEKSIQDQYYARRLKRRYSHKTFESHFLFPWCVCISGLIIASVTFIIEFTIKRV